MSLPTATSSGCVASVASGDTIRSPRATSWRWWFGHLDADRRSTRDGRQDAHVDGGHRVGDVLLQAGDPGDLDAGPELELVAGDRRADGHPEQRASPHRATRATPAACRPRASTDLVRPPAPRRAVEDVSGGQHPVADASPPIGAPSAARLASPASCDVFGFGARRRRLAARRLVPAVVARRRSRRGPARAAPAMSRFAGDARARALRGARVVAARHDRCSASTCRRCPTGRPCRAARHGPGDHARGASRIVRNDVRVTSSAPPTQHGQQHDDGAGRGARSPRAVRRRRRRPSRRPRRCASGLGERGRVADDVQEPEHRTATTTTQPMTSRIGLDGAAPRHEDHAGREPRARRKRPSPRNHPASVSTPGPSGPGEVDVHAQGDQDAEPISATPTNSCSRPATA